jgi:hypothetical protein
VSKTANIQLELQPYIQHTPQALSSMYGQACASDAATIESWRSKWLANTAQNSSLFGPFASKGVGLLHQEWLGETAIVAGSGPSLALNIGKLKDRPKHINLISCLHNFHAMEDNNAEVDYYVSLDAGPVTIEEVSEGGSKTESEYWSITAKRKLIAFIGTDPELIKKWQGQVYFFNAPIPDEGLMKEIAAIDPFHQYVSNGGNVLGACTYIAKGWLGATTLVFIGADFSFSNREKVKFHYWDSKYDASIGHTIRTVDIYGNSIKTWPSYYNFKTWFDYVTQVCPGIYINATEGGIFGAYREGNIMSVIQMDLEQVFNWQSMSDKLKYRADSPTDELMGKDVILF